MGRIGIAAVLLLGLVVAGTASAQMYKWVDKDGNVVYSQIPPPADQPVTTLSVPKSPSPTKQSPLAKKNESESSERAQPQADAGEAGNREVAEQNCMRAKENLNIYRTNRRVQRDDQIIVLTDQKRKELVEEAEQQVKTYCQ